MHTSPQLLDVVALLADLPSHGLRRGQVGTVVEMPSWWVSWLRAV